MFQLNQQQGQKNPLQLFVSLPFTMTIGFLPQEINKGRFSREVRMMVMRNSVFDMHESLLSGMKTLKSAAYKYLNSIFTPLLMNYDLPKPYRN